MDEFRKEIESVINKHSQENVSNTPDFILATYILGCLNAFDTAVLKREAYYGRPEKDKLAEDLADATIGEQQ